MPHVGSVSFSLRFKLEVSIFNLFNLPRVRQERMDNQLESCPSIPAITHGNRRYHHISHSSRCDKNGHRNVGVENMKTTRIAIFALTVAITGCMPLVPSVKESSVPLARSQAPATITLTGAFPESATNIYFATASVGPGGRLKMYRFDAPVAELMRHAYSEASNHWEKVTVVTSSVTQAEFDQALFQNAYHVKDLSWFDVETIEDGVEFRTGDHGAYPTMWVDRTRERFYLLMSD